MPTNAEKEKELAANEAVKFIEPGQTIGLGTGSTVFYAVQAVGEMVKNGLQIKAVSTSEKTSAQAASLNIPLIEFDAVEAIDLTIDGADEFDANLNLIKGGGGALLIEKMVARFSQREIIIADSSKRVEILGKFKVPVEVTPFTVNYVLKKLAQIGGAGIIRQRDAQLFETDTGNLIIDADFGAIRDPAQLSDEIDRIEGVVCHGLFINLAQLVIMAQGDKITTFKK
jgi:ribose 5-phosphate isomerase A